jgi:hypothetical protein
MKIDIHHNLPGKVFGITQRYMTLIFYLLLTPFISCSKGPNMKNDIHQIIEKTRISLEDVEQIFQVKLHPDATKSTKYIHVFTGESSAQAVLYDDVEFRKFASDTKFFAIVYMNGNVVFPEAEVEKTLGTKGSFEPANDRRKEKARLIYHKNGKKIVFAYRDNLKHLSFFTIEGELQN